jgi:hypothetical protein
MTTNVYEKEQEKLNDIIMLFLAKMLDKGVGNISIIPEISLSGKQWLFMLRAYRRNMGMHIDRDVVRDSSSEVVADTIVEYVSNCLSNSSRVYK